MQSVGPPLLELAPDVVVDVVVDVVTSTPPAPPALLVLLAPPVPVALSGVRPPRSRQAEGAAAIRATRANARKERRWLDEAEDMATLLPRRAADQKQ